MRKIQLMRPEQCIRVSARDKPKVRGTVIGSCYDGSVGVLWDTGEYVDIPETRLKVVRKERGESH